MMQTKLFFRLLLVFIFLAGNQNIQAQTCDVELEFTVDGSPCAQGGKAKVTITPKAGEGASLDLSENTYVISKGGTLYKKLSNGSNVVELPPADNYIIYSTNILCNGQPANLIDSNGSKFKVTLGLNITKAEYKRCSTSDIYVSVAVLGGTGPYVYRLIANGNEIDKKSSAEKEISFPATTTSSDLKIEVIDAGCDDNTAIKNLATNFYIGSSIIEGDKAACVNETIELSVKNEYSGSNFRWTKGNTEKSTSRTLKISNITEKDAGEYIFSMNFEGCSNVYTETVNIEVGNPPAPKVETAYICLNSGEVSLSKYVFATSKAYTLVWYKSDNSLIGETAPMFNANGLPGTSKYLVSQKNSTGCESPKAELTVTLENLPPKAGENNIISCTSNDSKPKIRVINAGSYTYNLYTAYSGGVKIGSGTAVSDTAIIKTTQDLTVGNNYFLETQNAHGCVSSERAMIRISLKESWILGPEKVCLGDNISLSADYAGGTVVWTKPDNSVYTGKTLKIDDATFENTGVYSLLIEDPGLGCIMKDDIKVTVTQPAPPKVDKDSYRFYENEAATPLIATPKTGCTLKWYYPEETLLEGQAPTPATNKTGTFVYYVSQDSLGCESPKVSVKVVVGEVPASVPASDVSLCIADKPVININNTVPNYKYTVYYKNNVIASGTGNGAAISLTSSVSVPENGEFGLEVSDTYNVSSERIKINVISVNNLIDLQKSSTSVCEGSTGKLIANDITDADYVWTTPNNSVINGQSISIVDASSADAGIYTLSVTASGCPAATQTVELKVARPAKPYATKEIYYCTGDNASKLTATPLAGYKLVWFDESQAQLPDAPSPNTSTSGTSVYYVAQVSISDANCSSDKEEVTVIVDDKPASVVLEPVNVCSTLDNTPSLSIRIPASTKGYIYSVYTQETGGSLAGHAASAGDGLPVVITINDNEISSGKIYYLEITNKSGCVSDRTPVEIIVTEITLSPNTLPSYQVDEFYAQKLTTNVSNPQYAIVQGYLPLGFTLSSTGDISGVASSYADPSVFTVEVTNSLGCSIQKEYTLKSELLVSKMFSPNGDGINDVFMKGYKVVIFDRLGRRLSGSDDGWDGTYNGKAMPEDVYFYIIYYKDKDGKEQSVISYVTLIKTM
ncbi:MAG: T9SS type B sorting domain-containing protein [Prevotellaceae bacterium]|jgi:gliding motility-associated-like protein|nr:T9SS type B sorting domain-containing protein [Prevotellaceae bacterium]